MKPTSRLRSAVRPSVSEAWGTPSSVPRAAGEFDPPGRIRADCVPDSAQVVVFEFLDHRSAPTRLLSQDGCLDLEAPQEEFDVAQQLFVVPVNEKDAVAATSGTGWPGCRGGLKIESCGGLANWR